MDHIHFENQIFNLSNQQTLKNIENMMKLNIKWDVLFFGTGLWTLKLASSPLHSYTKYLPHFTEMFHQFFEVKYGTRIIWKTIHYEPNQKYVKNGILGEVKDELRVYMNLFGSTLANEYNWTILNDFDTSLKYKHEIIDGIHYPLNSTIMSRTINIFKYYLCSS